MTSEPEPPAGNLPPGRYVVDGGEKPDAKHASFRLVGEQLDPDAISQATGLVPDHAHRKGDLLRPPRDGADGPRRFRGVWLIDSESELPRDGNRLEDHVVWLLDRLDPIAPSLIRLVAEYELDVDFWCGYWQGQWNSSFGLSAKTLARIARLGAAISFDLYGAEDAPDRIVEIAEPES